MPDTISVSQISGPQLITATEGELFSPLPVSLDTYRTIRKDPTVALAKALRNAAIRAGEWIVEADDGVPEEIMAFVKEAIVPYRSKVYRHALSGTTDFGWQSFEVVYALKLVGGATRIAIAKFKPLLHDLSTIMVDETTGDFVSIKQVAGGVEVFIPAENALLISMRVEGTDWYGTSLLENIRGTYNDWLDTNVSANRYDRKIAGSRIVIYYPFGTSIYKGDEVDNATIAEDLSKAIESHGSLTVPRMIRDSVEALEAQKPGWEIVLLSDKTAGAAQFIPRLDYEDKKLVRGMLLPERSLLEGQHGTKAEAGVHADMAVTLMEEEDGEVADAVNDQVVDPLIMVNFGPEWVGRVRLRAAPLVDKKVEILTAVYEKILSTQATAVEEVATIDTGVLKDALGVPRASEEDEEAARSGAEEGPDEDEVEATDAINGDDEDETQD